MADELSVPALGRVYCQKCGLLMVNGFCLHGTVDEAIARAFESGRGWFGGEVVLDQFRTVTRSR